MVVVLRAVAKSTRQRALVHLRCRSQHLGLCGLQRRPFSASETDGEAFIQSVEPAALYRGHSTAEVAFAWASLWASARPWLLTPSLWLLRRASSTAAGSLSVLWAAPVNAIVRRLVFPHYCAGEKLEDCERVSQTLSRSGNVRMVIDHSQEERESPEDWANNLASKQELLRNLAAAYAARVNAVPFKATSIMCPFLLERMTELILESADWCSIMPDPVGQLTPADRQLLDTAEENLAALCQTAAETGVTLWMDAEQSYRQPAMDFLARRLMGRFNRPGKQPVVYNTYQMYLVGADTRVERDMQHAKDNGYCFAGKLVRGAYIVSEAERANELGQRSPVHASKADTDAAYDRAVSAVMHAIAAGDDAVVAVCTHNLESVTSAMRLMEELGVPKESTRVNFAQILGMSNHVTAALGSAGYNSNKLVLFGSFEEVFPWLLRRLDENRDMLGACQAERPYLLRELRRRLTG
eukprot:TRINITY_DN21099_c0_g1_i2.p1 TRINITY_DN21099_c0_g1~~TRINITY_DN21099_c0_g1_i2.p1  ORF type:complete len:467 (-),score=105.29 TRINITY_DN21099_c0_g1_i2:476-1876(-)